ncbi:MAG: Tad domain-containing protein, partial [Sandarakinorhabdus sp.]|nr:Tad domain-containing protein [Sandarakinorhabdus sp.]
MTKPRKPTGLLGRKEERGAIAALSAIVMIAVIGSAGLAVDLSRIWLLSARLKTAVDASSLVAARTIDAPVAQRDGDTRALFWANMTRNGTQQGFVLSQIANPTAQPVIERVSDTRIRVSA